MGFQSGLGLGSPSYTHTHTHTHIFPLTLFFFCSSSGTFNGMFYQTENGGDTWTVQKLPYHYIYDISLVDAGHAYASAFMVDGNSGVLVYN